MKRQATLESLEEQSFHKKKKKMMKGEKGGKRFESVGNTSRRTFLDEVIVKKKEGEKHCQKKKGNSIETR